MEREGCGTRSRKGGPRVPPAQALSDKFLPPTGDETQTVRISTPRTLLSCPTCCASPERHAVGASCKQRILEVQYDRIAHEPLNRSDDLFDLRLFLLKKIEKFGCAFARISLMTACMTFLP